MVGNTTVGYVLIAVIVCIVLADFLTPLKADAAQLSVIAGLVGLLLGGRYLQQEQRNASSKQNTTDEAKKKDEQSGEKQ